jgi:hypothetical protein
VGDSLRWPRDPLYPLKLALISPTSGGRSVGIVRACGLKPRSLFIGWRWVMNFTLQHIYPRGRPPPPRWPLCRTLGDFQTRSLWQKTDPLLSSQKAPYVDRTVTVKQKLTSGHEPQLGLDTKTDWLPDRHSQCDFDFDFEIRSGRGVEEEHISFSCWKPGGSRPLGD